MILDLVSKDHLFGGKVPAILQDPEGLKGWHLDVLDAGRPEQVQTLARELFGRTLTPAERRTLSRVCRLIARRSARLAASLISGSLTRVARRSARRVTVAVDGSLFEKYPRYHRMLAEGLRELEGRAARAVQLKLTKDGSGIGAAVIAAVASPGRE